MTHETPWDLVAKILAWNKHYAAKAEEAKRQREAAPGDSSEPQPAQRDEQQP